MDGDNLTVAPEAARRELEDLGFEGLHLRRVPHNVEAEMGLLGSILVFPKTLPRVSGALREHHFALAEHRQIYGALLGLGHVDPVTAKSALDTIGIDAAYIGQLVRAAVTPMNAAHYAFLIQDLATRRELISLGEDVIARAYGDAGADAAGQIEETFRDLRDLSNQAPPPISVDRYLADAIDARPDVEASSILGSFIGKKSIVMICGAKKTGKTFLMTQIGAAIAGGGNLLHWESRRAARVLYLDYEVGWEKLRERRMAARQALPAGYGRNMVVMSYDEEGIHLPRLDSPDGVGWLERQIDATGAEIVIIDNVGKVTTETVSDDTTAKRLADAYRACHRRGCGVVIGHHTGHDTSRASGSSVFLNDVTAAALLEDQDQDPLTVDLRWTDVRHGDKRSGDFTPVRLALNPHLLVLQTIGQRPPRVRPAPQQRWAFDMLSMLIRNYGLASALPASLSRPGTSIIYLQNYYEEYKARMPGATDQDAKRDIQAMVKAGAVCFRANMLWIRSTGDIGLICRPPFVILTR